MQQAAADVGQLAFNMLGQGVGSEQLTQFISALNDALTRRVIQLNLANHNFDGIEWSWLAFGSEGRDEQTFSTDQDNGIVFQPPADADVAALKQRFLAYALDVNKDLDRCGFPLCKGNIMASNPQWCLTLDEWKEQFGTWIRQPHPDALLNATIFFDFRSLYGKAELAEAMRPRQPHEMHRRQLDFIGAMDRRFVSTTQRDMHVEAAISNYEMAWRMQSAVPELCEISGESEATRKLYGLDDPEPKKAAYARQCLLARRLVERGVRFIELSTLAYNLGGGNGSNPWDHHSSLNEGHGKMANQIDQPIAALVKDLKARALLDRTLIVWAGEFGRTPFAQGSNGRDHNPYGFTVWMAGGGVKGGVSVGATDEWGYKAVQDRFEMYDLHATMLHLMGFDHRKLTYRHAGLEFRLTGIEEAHVVKEILA